MARPKKDGFPEWKPQRNTIRKFYSSNFRERYKALRNSSSNFIRKEEVRNYIFEKYNHKCYICGFEGDLQIDHIVSVYEVAKGIREINYLNREENLAAICTKCNSSKSA